MIQGICFDLDGVLIHTDELHYLAWKGLADRLGVPFSREQGDRCRGVSRMQSLEIVLEHAGRAYSQEEKERFAQEKNEAYRAMLEALSPADVPEDVPPTLEELRRRGCRLALASGSKNAGLILARTGLRTYLDAAADGKHITRSKPDPEIFLTAAQMLGLPPGALRRRGRRGGRHPGGPGRRNGHRRHRGFGGTPGWGLRPGAVWPAFRLVSRSREGGRSVTRLVACDIDGTLLDGSTAIAPAVFTQIRRLSRLGVYFCPASGRQYSSLRRLFAPVAGQLSCLCENGAVVFGPGDPGPILSKTEMAREQALALCRDILALPRCEVLISGANTSYLCPKQSDVVSLMRDFVGNNVALLSAPEETPEAIVKVSAYCRDGAAAVEPLLAPRWRTQFRVAVAGQARLDFTLADKGTGIRQLCAALDVPQSDVMAFGDNYNDFPMLEAVGHPILMEGALAELLSRFSNRCSRAEHILASLPF